MNRTDWAEVPVVDLAAPKKWAINGGPFGSKLVSRDYIGEGVPVIRGTNLPFDKRFSADDFVFVSEEKADDLLANNAHPGDVIITQRGTLGQVGILPLTSPYRRFVISQSQMKITVDGDRVDANWLYYYLRNPVTQQEFVNRASSSGVPHINLGVLREFRVLLPPLATQRRIASILSAYDDLIENNTRRIAILEEMARRIYEEWFVRFRFPGHEQVKMVESELGMIPEGWEVTTIGKVAANHDRKRKPLSKMQREQFKGPYPYYGAAKIFDYVQDYIFDGRFVLMAEDGSVVTPDGFPVLQLANGKFWANNHTHILQGTNVASTEFIYLRLSNELITGYITGAAQPKITQENMNRIPVVLPPENLMEQFTKIIKPNFDLIDSLDRKNANLRTTRDLLLPKLISGELDVSNLPEQESVLA